MERFRVDSDSKAQKPMYNTEVLVAFRQQTCKGEISEQSHLKFPGQPSCLYPS